MFAPLSSPPSPFIGWLRQAAQAAFVRLPLDAVSVAKPDVTPSQRYIRFA